MGVLRPGWIQDLKLGRGAWVTGADPGGGGGLGARAP